MYFQLLGWAPDVDPATPGALIDVQGAIPQTDGFTALPPFNQIYGTTGHLRAMAMVYVSASKQDLWTFETTSDSTASTGALYSLSGWTAALKRNYTAVTYTTPVIFKQFDAETFVVRKGSPLVVCPSTGTNVTAITAPSFSTAEVTKDFVIGFDADTGYDWHCSAIGNGRDWNLSVSNQCVRGKFFNKQGPIVAAARNGEGVLCFTETQTWLGRYVGPPDVWQWENISQEVGCVGAEAAVETPYGTCWMGGHDIYIFNGGQISSLNTEPVRRTIFGALQRTLMSYTQLAWDRKLGLLWVFAVGSANTSYDARDLAYCYHFETKRWSPVNMLQGDVVSQGVRAANQISVQNYDPVGLLADNRASDSMLLGKDTGSGSTLIGFFDQTLQTAASATVTTAYVGDPTQLTMVRSVRPRYSTKNDISGAILLESRLKAYDGGATASQTAVLDADFKFNTRQTGRYHSVRLTLKGRDVVSALDIDMVPVGRR